MRRFRTLLLVPLSALAVTLSALTATPAQAADTGSISGRLLAKPTGGTAAPYPTGGVEVSYNDTDESFDSTVVGYADVQSNGTFTVSGLEDGYYWLRAYGGDYATEYYANTLYASTATSIRVSGGAVTLSQDIVLEEPGAVTGRVVDAAGRPVAGASVSFLTSPTSGGQGLTTGADGRFDTRSNQWLELVPGTYVMEVSFWSQDLGGKVYRTSSQNVTVGAGQVVTRNATLQERPSAVFTVLDPAGRPLVEAPLVIWIRDAELNGGQWGPIQSGPHTTDATGRYRFVDGIDEVRFQVRPPAGGAGAAEWWDDAATFETARTLTFPDGVAVRRDFTIRLDEAATSPAAPTAPPAPPTPGAGSLSGAKPKLVGTARVGRTLKVRLGAWSTTPERLAYAWFRGTKRIAGASKPAYRLTRQDLRQRISVRVTASKQGYRSVTVRSARTAKVAR